LQNELAEAEDLEKQARKLRQKLFGSRIVSRTDVDDLGPIVKSLKRIFPCGGTMEAVVDDREDVWANA
jgi:RNA polymerase II subunit A C-terminal domain phosphatase